MPNRYEQTSNSLKRRLITTRRRTPVWCQFVGDIGNKWNWNNVNTQICQPHMICIIIITWCDWCYFYLFLCLWTYEVNRHIQYFIEILRALSFLISHISDIGLTKNIAPRSHFLWHIAVHCILTNISNFFYDNKLHIT